MNIPEPEEFFETVLENAVSIITLASSVSGLRLSDADVQTIQAGASAGITATVDELFRRGLLVTELSR